MKVFLSWSGGTSQAIAAALRVWLRRVIQAVDPFLSSHDIAKGEVWLLRLLKELDQSSVGIICVTEESIHSDWLNFEAGALAKHLGTARVCTLLLDVDSSDLGGPLSQFQSTTVKKSDLFQLLVTINTALGAQALPSDELAEQFETRWPELETAIRQALALPRVGRSDLEELTEELLLPVIYRETLNGDVDTVFDWLELAEKKRTVTPGGQLSIVEAALARVTGKKKAAPSLKELVSSASTLAHIVWIEYLFLAFAIPCQKKTILQDPRILDLFPETHARTANALLGLWSIREGDIGEAQACLAKACPGQLSGDAGDHQRALSLGLLCLALGDQVNAEFHLDRVRKDPARHLGYPFVGLTNFLDVEFVGALFRGSAGKLDDSRVRAFRGHAWVLMRISELIRSNSTALDTLHALSLNSKWRKPLEPSALSERLVQFEKSLRSGSGVPFPLS